MQGHFWPILAVQAQPRRPFRPYFRCTGAILGLFLVVPARSWVMGPINFEVPVGHYGPESEGPFGPHLRCTWAIMALYLETEPGPGAIFALFEVSRGHLRGPSSVWCAVLALFDGPRGIRGPLRGGRPISGLTRYIGPNWESWRPIKGGRGPLWAYEESFETQRGPFWAYLAGSRSHSGGPFSAYSVKMQFLGMSGMANFGP